VLFHGPKTCARLHSRGQSDSNTENGKSSEGTEVYRASPL